MYRNVEGGGVPNNPETKRILRQSGAKQLSSRKKEYWVTERTPGQVGRIKRQRGMLKRTMVMSKGKIRDSLRLNRIARRMKGIELKRCDSTVDVNPISIGGGIYSLGSIAQGRTDLTRTGIRIRATKLTGTIVFYNHPSATYDQLVRVILFRDKDNQGFAPGVTDLLTGANVTSLFRASNRSRFMIMMDKTYSVTDGPGATGSQMARAYYVRGYIPKKGIAIEYSGPAASDYGSESIWLCVICLNAGGGVWLQMRSRWRLEFYG